MAHRTGPLEPWRLKKQRLGLAWQERDEGEAWRKRRGRCPEGWLDERAAHLAAVAAMDAQAGGLVAEAQAAAKAAAAALTVRVLAHDWLSWLEEVWGAKPSTIKDYSFLLREPGEAFKRRPGKTAGRIMKAFGDRPAAEVTTREVSDFLRSLDREGLTPRNVNKHREVLAAMFTYGCRADSFALRANPVLGTDKRRQTPPAALDYYEVEEVEALARACEQGRQREPREIFDEAEREARHQEDEQDAEAFRLLFYTGLRVGEMLTLRWGDIDLDGRVLFVRRGLSAGVEGLPKGGRPRIVLSQCLRFMRSRDSARATISRVLRTMSSLTALVAGSMPLRCAAATSGGAWPRACDRSVFMGCGMLREASSPVPRTPSLSGIPGSPETVDDRSLCEREGASGGARALGRRVCARRRAGSGGKVTSSEAVDPDGRRVVLDIAGWRHIIDEHEELESHRDAVLATVAAPDHRGSDPRPGRERYWRRGLGPSRWLMVVVDYESVPARIVTAYGNRRDPPGWTP